MRLLRIDENGEFSLVDVIDTKSTPYAILSHTWGDSEITYQELLDGPDEDKAGYRKIRSCAEKTAEKGLKYFWVDTYCIDKSSSAELSEAINTMYRWYQEAEICFAHLEGASPDLFISGQSHDVRWFTRGWTLQELLAPREVAFFDSQWFPLGTRTEHAAALSEMTGIHAEALQHPPERSTKRRGTYYATRYKPILSFSIAQRMSWAAKRITTRSEDLAYCLLGIFDVNMPLLYGEGSKKAFVRLQEEIMKDSNDQSLFAWRRFCAGDDPWEGYSLLAQSPSDFGDSASFVPVHYTSSDDTYSMTNKGLRITLQMVKVERDLHIALLDCVEKSTTGQYAIVALALRSYSGNIYGRIAIHTLRLKDLISCRYPSDTYTFPKQWPCTSQTIYVLKIYRPGLHTSTFFSSKQLEIQPPRKVYGSEFELSIIRENMPKWQRKLIAVLIEVSLHFVLANLLLVSILVIVFVPAPGLIRLAICTFIALLGWLSWHCKNHDFQSRLPPRRSLLVLLTTGFLMALGSAFLSRWVMVKIPHGSLQNQWRLLKPPPASEVAQFLVLQLQLQVMQHHQSLTRRWRLGHSLGSKDTIILFAYLEVLVLLTTRILCRPLSFGPKDLRSIGAKDHLMIPSAMFVLVYYFEERTLSLDLLKSCMRLIVYWIRVDLQQLRQTLHVVPRPWLILNRVANFPGHCIAYGIGRIRARARAVPDSRPHTA